MELNTGMIFESHEGRKYEIIKCDENILLNQLTPEGTMDTKKVKYPKSTFEALIKNKTFFKTLCRTKNDIRDILALESDSDQNLRDMSK